MRIFIIGNGPSLNQTDLDLIAGQPSIACNRINLLYPHKNWRPDIYVHPESLAPDIPYIQENVDMGVECYLGEHFAPPPRGVHNIQDAENIHWIKDCHHHLYNFASPEVPDEWHLPQLCSFGGSVNVAMQIAVQKGFDELVLLGCDLQYTTRNRSHFSPAYEHGGEQTPFFAAKNAFFGHIQAMNWIRRKQPNIKVYNATPGGLLELWERVSFEDILSR
jgi:hypothetical protein